jgi:GT2 family glycosyltransferase
MSPISASDEVDVCIVTWNDAKDLEACLENLTKTEHRALHLSIVDCASSDSSVEVARRFAERGVLPTTVTPLDRNVGYAGGMNEGMRHGRAPWVLVLNPDAAPAPDYFDRMLEAAAEVEAAGAGRIGAVTGRLVRVATGGETPPLDACGMRLTPTWRHLDRGSGEPDTGQFSERALVFGATGAASLFRREALEDVSLGGRAFDDWFHTYREDAELCFRLQERGWDVLYEPTARAVHRRLVTPGRRRQLSKETNFHSLKNRYLIRAYHQTAWNFVATLPFTLVRDALAIGWVLVGERTSLPAYGWLWRNRRALLERRRTIQGRKTRAMDGWFARQSIPLPRKRRPIDAAPRAPSAEEA